MATVFHINGVDVVLIERAPEAPCELCGVVAELRPYGPKSERVCFECGIKDEEAAERQFHRMLLG